jgi:hypothetical protein
MEAASESAPGGPGQAPCDVVMRTLKLQCSINIRRVNVGPGMCVHTSSMRSKHRTGSGQKTYSSKRATREFLFVVEGDG